MSLFNSVELTCPACRAAVAFRVVHSVNAVRAPELRRAILDQTFQRATCSSCALDFRYAPEFTYVDSQRGQWVAALPLDRLRGWREAELSARSTFEGVYGAAAPPALQALGRRMRPRITFGWAGVREKLLIADLALDDVSVELCKAIVLRASQEAPLSRETELRLVDSDSKGLALAWLSAADEVVGDSLHLSRRLYDEITSNPEGAWAPLRSDLTQGLFVDLARLMFAD
jgi:hypothetical protein